MKLNNTLTKESMIEYLTDLRNDESYVHLSDREIIEEYVVCHLNCLNDESIKWTVGDYSFKLFIDSVEKLFNELFGSPSYTKRFIEELTEQNDTYFVCVLEDTNDYYTNLIKKKTE